MKLAALRSSGSQLAVKIRAPFGKFGDRGRQTMRAFTTAFLLLMLSPNLSFAGEADNLRSLRTFFLAVEPPSDVTAKCGFTRQWLAARVQPIITNAGITLVKPDQFPDGFIEVVVTALPNCVVSASIEVSTMARIDKNSRTAMVTVWRAAGIGGNEVMASNLDALANSLARDWRFVNR